MPVLSLRSRADSLSSLPDKAERQGIGHFCPTLLRGFRPLEVNHTFSILPNDRKENNVYRNSKHFGVIGLYIGMVNIFGNSDIMSFVVENSVDRA